ncbi:MAG: methyl-accepting chemotaxis protein [Oscillospiraceae bacterium]|jgi:methyl-accepting chemotaxis protein|nr:methyl-accepting chemotaxis protein [Oscillospiraceae bacterium]
MKWFANMKIRMKMILSFMLVIALMVALTVVTVTQMSSVNDDYSVAINNTVRAKECITEVQLCFRDARRATVGIMAYAGESVEKCESLYQESITAIEESKKWLDEFEKAVNTNPRFNQADKDARFARSTSTRNLMSRYRSELVEPMIVAARANDRATVIEISSGASEIADAVRGTTIDMKKTAEEMSEVFVSNASNAASRTMILTIVIACVAALISFLIALFMANYFSVCLVPMAAFLKKAGTTGDIGVTPEERQLVGKYSQFKDELGNLAIGVTAFIRHVTNISDELKTLAQGDLTSDAKPLSDADVMGASLRDMVTSFNSMFGEINSATSQVSTGAKQVADGSQALAQGSTEQAVSIEQLSNSISAIADKTKTNADMAGRAATLANSIMQNAEKGSRQMDEMMLAVRDINMASQSISKVIKVIDDIAFQTNILALNAAVEAARAGQHGKGFAVVAEEVRNLASKSAEAAKETGNLIANSTEKAELGSRIAGETSASLAEIVQGINESGQLVSQIAQSSNAQSQGITQINEGIDQVAQVVQLNSATSEESAAASEQMSSQSSILEGLISQFKLKGEGHKSWKSVSPKHAPQRQLAAMPERAFVSGGDGDFGKY